jgi:hypothetical protein
MKKEVKKEGYELPRIAIRGIVLEEGVALQSHTISFEGEVQYNDYIEVAETFGDDAGAYALIF